MNILNKTRILFLGAFLLVSLSMMGQAKQSVILINSVPFNASISPTGEILEILGEAKGHMKGFKNTAPPSSTATVATSETIGGNSTSVSRQREFIAFGTGNAALENEMTQVLDGMLANYNAASGDKILITVYRGSDSEDPVLADNRLKACRSYLELKGVALNNIQSEIAVSAPLKDKIAVSFVR